MYVGASLTASAVNYLYYPTMSHLLRVEEYGELQVIASFILQLNTITISLYLINVNLVANYDKGENIPLMVALQKVAVWFSVTTCAAIAIASGLLKAYFHFASSWPFLLIIPVLLMEVSSALWVGYLQGHGDFVSISVYGISAGCGKIFFSMILALLGFGAAGGVLGLAFGFALSIAILRLTAGHPLPRLRQTLCWPRSQELRALRAHAVYSAEVIVSLVITSLLLSVDVFLVKHLFPDRFAGQYAGVATVARIIFYASAPLVAVMLPSITLKDRLAGHVSFRRALIITLAICLSGLITFGLFSSELLTLLLGRSFAESSRWLLPLSIVAGLVAITNVMVNYLLALRSHGAIVVSLVSLAVAVLLVLLRHATVFQIVTSTSLGLLAGQLTFGLIFALSVRRKIPEHGLMNGHHGSSLAGGHDEDRGQRGRQVEHAVDAPDRPR
jgi:O-antigen/teichoic acid export membrane protein